MLLASKPMHHLRKSCRACDGTDHLRFLELGPQPLANGLLSSLDEAATEPRFPLDVYFCRGCGLVQLLDVVDPEVMFRNYLYATGNADSIAPHNQGYASAVVQRLGLGATDLVVEVASNDGSLLGCFRERGVRTLGIEPATNIAEMARAKGLETINEFFGAAVGQQVAKSHGLAMAVIGNNVLAHVDDTVDFLSGARHLLAPKGNVIVEFPYLGELLNRLEYDTVYHEHLCYFSVAPLLRLFERAGLSVVRVDRVEIHGGSLRVWGARRDQVPAHAPEVLALVEQERGLGYLSEAHYAAMGPKVIEHRRRLLELLRGLKASGHSLAAYGAPAKGNTLLNYCGIGTDLIPFTVDRSPLKVGLLTPGMHIPVLPVQTLLERRPDYTLILAWNFADEIMRQQSAYAAAGGRFIIPIPEPRIVSAS